MVWTKLYSYLKKKQEAIKKEIKHAIRAQYISSPSLCELNGKIRHGAMEIQWINGLFSPINEALAKDVKYHRLNKKNPLTLVLEDALLRFHLVTDNLILIQ